MEWLSSNSSAISAVTSFFTLLVWLFYAQLLYLNFRRQRQPKIIINRGGGNLVVELAWATPDENGLDDREVEVSCDGVVRTVPARGKVALRSGESITLPPKLYHQFYGEEGKGTVLVGEVSKTNDDNTDNRFLDDMGRFPQIEEDEAPLHLLVSDYADRL